MNLLQGLFNLLSGLLLHAGTFTFHLVLHVLSKVVPYLIATLNILLGILPGFGSLLSLSTSALSAVTAALSATIGNPAFAGFWIILNLCGFGQVLAMYGFALVAKLLLKATVLFK